MIVFIIPVKSSLISSNWKRFSQLFERCIKSVCNQTSTNFQVVVVCNEKPDTSFESPHIEYLYVDFPPPVSEQVNPIAGLESPKEADKAKKILAGLEYAKKFNPSHVMVVDADDCINQNIAKFVEEHPEADGWYARKGYVYKEGKRYIYLNAKNFNDLCGTSIVVRADLAELLVTEGNYYDHTTVTLKNGKKLQPLPFAGSVYSVENQENYRMTTTAVKALATKSYQRGLNYWLEKISKYRIFLLTNSIRQQFGLYKLEA
ncbi:glycosyltransferase family A protein [Chamaesiphon minutus]|uniref:Glycosyl transferase family 2 n=1 Tax=Chamaesiphon minutus (strain ATCC 27169 / PCC 6605) TaxID=1173020 RepID=K9UNH1_CHAP6|nr:glycosyltransferase family A protein [Chamaesiphon minutus]AFY96350.1 Glycosyl transferase family 2 [Chamaesiphon minutus PCC 6605]